MLAFFFRSVADHGGFIGLGIPSRARIPHSPPSHLGEWECSIRTRRVNTVRLAPDPTQSMVMVLMLVKLGQNVKSNVASLHVV